MKEHTKQPSVAYLQGGLLNITFGWPDNMGCGHAFDNKALNFNITEITYYDKDNGNS